MNASQSAHESQRKPTLRACAVRFAWLAATVGCLSLPAETVTAASLNSGASGLSLTSPAAPSRSNHGGFEIVRKDRGMVDREVAIEAVPPEEVELEQYSGWRGYLHEKGPSRVLVEAEQQQEIQPLDDAIWDLIMGPPEKPVLSEAVAVEKTEFASLERNAVSIPKQQIANRSEVVEPSPEEEGQRIHREQGEADSVIIDDSAESYRQLMELFSQPMFVTPTQELNDVEGRVSFRIPQTPSSSPTIRQGSRARFEIRRQ